MTYSCANHPDNQRSFNDGYHVQHHLNSRLHWSQLPLRFVESLPQHAAADGAPLQGLGLAGRALQHALQARDMELWGFNGFVAGNTTRTARRTGCICRKPSIPRIPRFSIVSPPLQRWSSRASAGSTWDSPCSPAATASWRRSSCPTARASPRCRRRTSYSCSSRGCSPCSSDETNARSRDRWFS